MCGIAGGVFWRGVSRDEAVGVVSGMVKALAHRGPDGDGVYCDAAIEPAGTRPFAVLGHTRLAILDVSPAGAQPMGPAAGSGHAGPWITYNGETYNFRELRRELESRGARFHTGTDTEALLRAYDTWGIDMLQRLRGMFAFALWDSTAGRLLLARDRLGIKPLYYYTSDGYFLFASEVRALLASGLVPRRLDATALWQYLGYQAVPAPRTLVADVHALPPAAWMTVEIDGRRSSGEYWNMLSAARDATDTSPEEARRLVGDRLRDSVAAHMVSDVPVGAFLSGGIDSSAIVALMREGGFEPRTFSVGFAERSFDESEHAQTVARLFRAQHTHIQLRDDDLFDQLPDALGAMDQPTGDGINTYIVARAVRERGITVALSGLGGDEMFGGYPSFARLTRAAELSRFWAGSPTAVRSLAATAVRAVGRSSISANKAAALLETDGSLAEMFPLTRQVLSSEQRLALLDPRLLDQVLDRSDPYTALLTDAYREAPEGAGLFARISFAEARTYMHDVLLRDTDQMCMAHGLEARVPLLDHELVEQVTAMPDRVKQANGIPKPLLVESLGGLLPASIVERKKQGFVLPFDPWMRGALRPFCEARLGARGLAGRGLVDGTAVDGLWRSFLAGGKDVSWSRIWVLVVLDAWLEGNGVTQ